MYYDLITNPNETIKPEWSQQFSLWSKPYIERQFESLGNMSPKSLDEKHQHQGTHIEHQHKNHNNQRTNIPSLSICFLAFFRGVGIPAAAQQSVAG